MAALQPLSARLGPLRHRGVTRALGGGARPSVRFVAPLALDMSAIDAGANWENVLLTVGLPLALPATIGALGAVPISVSLRGSTV